MALCRSGWVERNCCRLLPPELEVCWDYRIRIHFDDISAVQRRMYEYILDRQLGDSSTPSIRDIGAAPDTADLLPELSRDTVYVGVSSGSMVVTPNFGEAYDGWFCREPPASNLPAGSDRALGLVDFSLFPHLDHSESPDNSMANAERWAAKGPVPTYAIDDQTAIQVVDGEVSVISEGHWKLFAQE